MATPRLASRFSIADSPLTAPPSSSPLGPVSPSGRCRDVLLLISSLSALASRQTGLRYRSRRLAIPTPGTTHAQLCRASIRGTASVSSSPDLTNFLVESPNDIPGFRVELRDDDVPGFSANENDVPPPESAWPASIDTAAPEPSDTVETSTVPPSVEEPDSTPQIPDWLNSVLTMPVPQLSAAFDPRTGRRIVPYEPVINWTRRDLTNHHDEHGTNAVGAYEGGIGAMPDPSSVEALATEQWAPPAPPRGPADSSARPVRLSR